MFPGKGSFPGKLDWHSAKDARLDVAGDPVEGRLVCCSASLKGWARRCLQIKWVNGKN